MHNIADTHLYIAQIPYLSDPVYPYNTTANKVTITPLTPGCFIPFITRPIQLTSELLLISPYV
jgi:hypothetical protein